MKFYSVLIGISLSQIVPIFAEDVLVKIDQVTRIALPASEVYLKGEINSIISYSNGVLTELEGSFDSKNLSGLDYHLKLNREINSETSYVEELYSNGVATTYEYALNDSKKINSVARISSEPAYITDFKRCSGLMFFIDNWRSVEGMTFQEFVTAAQALQDGAKNPTEARRPKVSVTFEEEDANAIIKISISSLANERRIETVHEWIFIKDSLPGLFRKYQTTNKISNEHDGSILSNSSNAWEASEFVELENNGIKYKFPCNITMKDIKDGVTKAEQKITITKLQGLSSEWERGVTAESLIPERTQVNDRINNLRYVTGAKNN